MPDLTPAVEPAPAPPPVDALLPEQWQRGHRLDERTVSAEPKDEPGWAFPWCICGAQWVDGACEVLGAIKAAWAAGVAEGRRQATEERTEEVERLQVLLDQAEQYARDLQDDGDAEAERDEEWGLRYKVDGLQREAGDGGHVFSSRDEAEQHITAWRRHYPQLTYTDVEYMSREVLTNPWVPRG